MIKYENSDTFTGVFNHGVLNREGKLLYISQSHTTAEGIWKDGLMDGEMNITTNVRNLSKGWQRCSNVSTCLQIISKMKIRY